MRVNNARIKLNYQGDMQSEPLFTGKKTNWKYFFSIVADAEKSCSDMEVERDELDDSDMDNDDDMEVFPDSNILGEVLDDSGSELETADTEGYSSGKPNMLWEEYTYVYLPLYVVSKQL